MPASGTGTPIHSSRGFNTAVRLRRYRRHSDEATINWRWYFEDLPPAVMEKDVVTLSEEYLARLEAFVAEWET